MRPRSMPRPPPHKAPQWSSWARSSRTTHYLTPNPVDSLDIRPRRLTRRSAPRRSGGDDREGGVRLVGDPGDDVEDLQVTLELHAVGARAAEQGEQLRAGERDGQV